MPSSPLVPAWRATTTIWFAVCPSITNIFVPDSVQASPLPLASIVMPDGVPLAVRLGERERGDGLTGRDRGEQLVALRVGAGVDDRVRREAHGGEVRRAEQHASHLLEHDAELDEAEPLPAVGLRDVEALQPELLGHLGPDGGVVAVGRLHEAPDLGLGALGLQELADGVPQLVLLVREREVHAVLPSFRRLERGVGKSVTGDDATRRLRSTARRHGPAAGRLAGRPTYAGLVARPAHFEDSDVRIDKFVVGPFENNVFVVRDKHSGEAVLIDAANEHELLLDVARATGVRRVLTTHGHWDHIQAVTAMRDAGLDVGIAEADAAMLPSYDFVIPDDEVYHGRRPHHPVDPHAGSHGGVDVVPPRGQAVPVHR